MLKRDWIFPAPPERGSEPRIAPDRPIPAKVAGCLGIIVSGSPFFANL
jgi:hypothetical protein